MGSCWKQKGVAPPASAISLACLTPFFFTDGEGVCVQAASWGLGQPPLAPGGPGITSESPRETVGTLDQCQEGKGRVDWEAEREREPGQGIAAEAEADPPQAPVAPSL